MTCIKLGLLLVLGALVSACASGDGTSRTAPIEAAKLPFAETAEPTQLLASLTDVRVENITVRVPRSLRVSEANSYLPATDIVWREDPLGDRHAQIAAIFETAMARGTQGLDGVIPVALDIEVTRFHALTEKARYTTGGVHNIVFNLTLRNAKTGALLTAPRSVRADLNAFGGRQALAAEARGHTQKVRITGHLSNVIRKELTTVEGFKNPRLGIIQVLNQI